MKILINASNLHFGGAVQVAVSFLFELSKLSNFCHKFHVVVSSVVNNNLKLVGCNTSVFLSYCIVDVSGLKWSNRRFYKSLNSFDIVFTVFGPLYTFRTSFFNIVGFAQAWIIYPKNEVYGLLSFTDRFLYTIKFYLQSLFFKTADYLVVEAEHVRRRLTSQINYKSHKIKVVNNCLSTVFYNPSVWQDVKIDYFSGADCDIKIGFLGRNYKHKNTGIFIDVAYLLYKKYGYNVKFFVTFSDDEWANCTQQMKNICINVGCIAVNQAPSFYKLVDCVLFPSLLECFSVTPLEAMCMEVPLFASDRPFIRDICSGFAYYFDPLCPSSVAEVIGNYFHDPNFRKYSFADARAHAINFSNPTLRANEYIDILLKSI